MKNSSKLLKPQRFWPECYGTGPDFGESAPAPGGLLSAHESSSAIDDTRPSSLPEGRVPSEGRTILWTMMSPQGPSVEWLLAGGKDRFV